MKFLVVVDTQYDFMMKDGKLPVPHAEEIIVPGIKFLANLDPEEYAGALFTFDTHHAATYPQSEEAKQFPPHCYKGTTGWENVFNTFLVPTPILSYRLKKGVFDMWEESNTMIKESNWYTVQSRDNFFSSLKEQVDTVQVMGVSGNVCVMGAVKGFLERGFKVELLTELTRSLDLGKGSGHREVFEEQLKNPNFRLV